MNEIKHRHRLQSGIAQRILFIPKNVVFPWDEQDTSMTVGNTWVRQFKKLNLYSSNLKVEFH